MLNMINPMFEDIPSQSTSVDNIQHKDMDDVVCTVKINEHTQYGFKPIIAYCLIFVLCSQSE